MKLIRDLLLILFPLAFVYFAPVFSELTKISNQEQLNILFRTNPILYLMILIPIGILVFMLVFIHKIDAWESQKTDEKADNRHQELLNTIKELINEIRQDRDERDKPKQ